MNNIFDEYWLTNINELYFGKSPELIKAEKLIDALRAKYPNNPKAINASSDKIMLQINSLLEDFFGFGRFAITVTFDMVPWVVTLPIGFNYSGKKRDNYIVNKHTYRFNKEAGYVCVVNVSSAVLFGENFTSEEIMAAIVREVGHSFYACISGASTILNNIYASAKIANVIVEAVYMFRMSKEVVDLAKKANDNAIKSEIDKAVSDLKQTVANNEAHLKYLYTQLEKYKDDPDTIAQIQDAILDTKAQIIVDNNTIDDYINNFDAIKADQEKIPLVKIMKVGIESIKPAATSIPILKYFITSRQYKDALNKVEQEFENNESANSALFVAWNYVKYALKTIGMSIAGAAVQIMDSLFSSGNLPKFTDVIKKTSMEIFLPFATFMHKVKNPLTWLMMPIARDKEEMASAFCTMYGYGSAYIEYADKSKSFNNNNITKNIVNKAPFVGLLFDAISTPAKILNGIYDPSPTGITLQYQQIKLLKAELAKTNMDPRMRKVIAKDLQACEDQIAKATSISKGIEDPDICKHMANRLLYDIFDNTVGKIDNSKQFARYDASVK